MKEKEADRATHRRVLFKRELRRSGRDVIAADFVGDATRFFFE
jgi:hypothetical protein